MIPFLVAGVGFLLIFIEFYLPGGIMGVVGGILLVSSIVLFAIHSGSPILTVLFILGLIVIFALEIKFALWKIKHGEPGHSIYSEGDQEGYRASSYEKDLIGKNGTVSSDLKPGGHIVIEGKSYSAISQSGYISKGQSVVVVSGEVETLIVKKAN